MTRCLLMLSMFVLTFGCASGDRPTAYRPMEIGPITAQSLRKQLAALPTERSIKDDGLAQTQALIERKLRGYGYSPTLETVPWQGVNSANVIVEIPGNTLASEIVLVGAHYDAVPGAPGADDNGSGTAALLELARTLRTATPQRTIRMVFFTFEESGLVGSSVHAKGVQSRGEQVVAMLSLEMLGYYSDEPNSQRFPPIPGLDLPEPVGNFIALVANANSSPMVRKLDAAMHRSEPDVKTYVLDIIPGNGELLPDTRRSDHAPFWSIGVPAAMVTDTANFRNPNYHTPADAIDTLDFARMAEVVRALQAGLASLASDEGTSKP